MRIKFFLGLGSMSDGAQLQLVGGVLLLYYNQILKLPAQWVSLALGVSLFIDAFWDPMLGHFSDNLRSRLGRRHGLMYLAALPAGAAFAAIWVPPAGLSEPGLFGWLLTFVMIFRLSHSLYMVPSGALIPELAPDYHDRTVLIGYRWMLGAMGGAITAVLVYGVFLRKTADFPLGQLNPAGYPPMALAVGLFIASTILISTLGTHSRIATLHRPAVRRVGLVQSVQEIAATLNNHNFVVALVAGMLGATSTALYQGLAIYFSTFMFHLPSSNIMVLILTLVVSAPIAFLIAPAASRRWGKRGACMALFFSSLLFTHGPIILRLIGAFPQNGSPFLLPSLILSGGLSGILSMGGFILSTSMIADIVEENQTKTGRRSEGLLFSSDQLLNKVVSGMATILPGLLLAAVQFPAGAKPETLDPEVMRHLALIYVPLATVLSIISIGMWRFYKISHDDHLRHLEIAEALAMADPTSLGIDVVKYGPRSSSPIIQPSGIVRPAAPAGKL
jgi:GPH family glycoside/pentoside/hexuronide:cation symporter